MQLKILIADDDRNTHKLYRLGLDEHLYDMRFVENGKDAIDAWKEWQPDVLILDIMMPVMSGFVALKQIRHEELTSAKKTPIIVATCLSDKRDVMDCMKVGIQGYLVKPVKSGELAEKIESCMKGPER